ncbi:MAG: heme-binding domain-containing protein [Bacteroidia bacterium]|nr:heme-binding domain-containing protein [Bacteroidia bacterium]
MKKAAISSLSVLVFLVFGLFLLSLSVTGQITSKASPALPDNINTIVTASCMPCHTSKGGLLSRGKLNFTEWTQYSTEKQKEKAEKMYTVLIKDTMPPKSVRETRPEIIPTKEQIEIIQKWAESIKSDEK